MTDDSCQFCLEFSDQQEAIYFTIGDRCPADRSLHRTGNFRVIPPLGSFVEGALMLVAESHVRSFADCTPRLLRQLDELMVRTSAVLAREYQAPIFFEHGPGLQIGKGTCCVDHAHLHAFPVEVDVFEFLDERFSGVELPSLEALTGCPRGSGGYLFVQQRGRRRAYACDLIPSQLVRQVIAARIGMPERWHWRSYLGLDELCRTYTRLRYVDWECP